MVDSETSKKQTPAAEVETSPGEDNKAEEPAAETPEARKETVALKETEKIATEDASEAKESEASASPESRDTKADKKRQARKKPTLKKEGPKKEDKKEGDESKETQAESEAASESPKVKKTPYVNPDRFKTGGQQMKKLTPEELAEKMERIRLNNEKIKERRLAVEADEQAFKASQEAQRAKQAAERRIQEGINRSREQNAQRKLEKIQGREWDSEKKPRGGLPSSLAGRGRGGPPHTPTRSPSGKTEGGANSKTPVQTPAAAWQAQPEATTSIKRDAPPHTTPVAASE